jgi:DNA-binding Lrp family transcriptional regulator
MIRDILEALEYDFRGEYIDIAKGKYKMPETIKEGIQQIKEELWHNK